jgi:hypothetical protein
VKVRGAAGRHRRPADQKITQILRPTALSCPLVLPVGIFTRALPLRLRQRAADQNAFGLTFDMGHSGRQVSLRLLQCTASVTNGVGVSQSKSSTSKIRLRSWDIIAKGRAVEAVVAAFKACRGRRQHEYSTCSPKQ